MAYGTRGFHKGSPIIPILSRINPIPRIDAYLFKVHYNIVLPSTLRSPRGIFPVSLPIIKSTLLPTFILATCTTNLNHLD